MALLNLPVDFGPGTSLSNQQGAKINNKHLHSQYFNKTTINHSILIWG